MGQRDKDERRDFGATPADLATAAVNRARTARLLERIAGVLGRPVGDFYGPPDAPTVRSANDLAPDDERD